MTVVHPFTSIFALNMWILVYIRCGFFIINIKPAGDWSAVVG